LGAGLFTVLDALQVKSTANDVVTHTWQIFNTTTTDENDRVLLQVVAFTTDVRNNFEAVGQTHFGDFTQSGVRLFGGRGVYTGANTAALWAVLERWALAANAADFARFTHELANGWHDLYVSYNVLYVLVDVCVLKNAVQLAGFETLYRKRHCAIPLPIKHEKERSCTWLGLDFKH